MALNFEVSMHANIAFIDFSTYNEASLIAFSMNMLRIIMRMGYSDKFKNIASRLTSNATTVQRINHYIYISL